MTKFQEQADVARLHRLRVFDGGVGGPIEDLALTAVVGLLLGRVVHLLEHAGHRQHVVGLEGAEILDQVRDVVGVPEDDAVLHTPHRDHPREDMCQRQEQQGGLAFGETGAHRIPGGRTLGEEVCVREYHTLRPAGGPRGVDQGRRIRRERVGLTTIEFVLGELGPALGDGGQRMIVDDEGLAQSGRLVDDPDVLGVLRVVLDEEELGPGVLQDPLHLVGRGGLVDGDGGGTGAPDGVVQDGPLVARRRQDGHPIARLDAGGDQSLGHRVDLVGEVLGRHIDPLTARLPLEQRHRRPLGPVAEDRVDRGRLVVHGEIRRGGVFLLHGTPETRKTWTKRTPSDSCVRTPRM